LTGFVWPLLPARYHAASQLGPQVINPGRFSLALAAKDGHIAFCFEPGGRPDGGGRILREEP